ncbi:zinc-ribbon domain-containing protein [Devosia sp.]|uniref:zinc-ribbon domain-containing protein n=1 Tax=Devosia sp. TaxID=1871048 RepID=UPI002AFE4D9D|nr:zinc-ribbon domain-containing protein [Devosia sp.]
MIITCPHCQTKYQVAYEAIGSAGRKVQCAHCRQAWQQEPVQPEDADQLPETVFDALAEDGLDEAMVEEERAVAQETAQSRNNDDLQRRLAASVDPALIRKRQKAFSRRRSAMEAELPLARLRRSLRVIGALLLVGVLGTAYFGRVQVVERFPDMAGLYAALGLGVNVVGLDFSDLTSLRTQRDGKEVLVVSAQIVGLARNPVAVPPVVVTLIDDKGQGIYEWSTTPSVRDLMGGERSSFDTQLTQPPKAAARVRLSFAGEHKKPRGGERAAASAPPPPAQPDFIQE